MNNDMILEWAQSRKAIGDAQARTAEAERMIAERKKEEQGRKERMLRLRAMLAETDFPLDVEEDVIRFGEYELRGGYVRYGDFALKVYAPAPWDIPDQDWEQPKTLAGELAYANIYLRNSSELAAWLLEPTTAFRPIPVQNLPEQPVFEPAPPTTAEQLVQLLGQLIDDRVDHRFEQLESSVDHLGSTIGNAGTSRDKTISDLQYRLNEQRNEIEDLRYRK